MKDKIENFIGIFPNAVSKEYCEKVINRFEYVKKSHGTEGKIWSRQEEERISPSLKDSDTYFLGGTGPNHVEKTTDIVMEKDLPLLQEFHVKLLNCYDKYTKKYGVVKFLKDHAVGMCVRVQKYKPSQGYHMWHCENEGVAVSNRMLVVALYLNTVKEGGETEFLYQGVRVSPVQGTLVLFPPDWTYTHRGNPPLKENKYFLTTWLNYTK